MQPALAGVRVLDVSRLVSGPVCAFYLACLGAEVIRIDSPGGDLTWEIPPFVGPDGVHRGPRRPDDLSIGHLKRDRGKASVTLNLEAPEGADLLRRLVAVSDVLVENFRPGVMDKLGLGYSNLARVNPRLIYCAVTGFGQDGPYRDYQGMDMILQAMTGLMGKTGFPDGPPTKTGFTVGDLVPSTFAALGILAALRQRELVGCGQFIDVSMFDVLTALMWDEPLDYYEDEGVPPRVGNADPRAAPINCYTTRDGYVVIVPASNAHWPRLCALLQRPDLAADPALENASKRARQAARLDNAVAEWMRERSTGEAVAALRAAGIPSGPVNSPWVGRRDPHVAARGVLHPLRHPAPGAGLSGFLGPNLPVKFSQMPVSPAPAETLGHSTRRVLHELLGLTGAELDDLGSRGII